MIQLKKTSIIYILCPAQTASGGPELLHQLAEKLKNKESNVFMHYYPNTKNPVNEYYKKYNTQYSENLIDNENNLLIIPETHVYFVKNYFNIKNIKTCVWWLSIDNFFKTLLYASKRFKLTEFGLNLAEFDLFKDIFFRQMINNKYDYHLSQSIYGVNFLEKKGIKSEYLSDYLNRQFIENTKNIELDKKENIVLYNPKKGIKFTQKIIKSANSIKNISITQFEWIPIINMTPEEVLELLKKSKIYIDFGEHPGKDRFPREAAISQCCVITGKKGSALFKDIPIPENYKIKDKEENIPQIIELINSCLLNFENRLNDFSEYREIIKKEEKIFIKDIDKIFIIK